MVKLRLSALLLLVALILGACSPGNPSVPAENTQSTAVSTTVAPVVTTEAPMATTEAPVVTTEAPEATTEAPMATTAPTQAATSSVQQATGTSGTQAAGATQPAGTQPSGTQTAGGSTGGAAACVSAVASDLVAAGEQTFNTVCAGCHGPQGQGQGNFPALAGNPAVTTQDPAQIAQLLQTFLNPQVHPFLTTMKNEDLAGVLSYVRASFGNDAAVICPEQLDALRTNP